MDHWYYMYHIAGIHVLCDLPFPVEIRAESRNFLEVLPAKPDSFDLEFCLAPSEMLPQAPDGGHWHGDWYFHRNGDSLLTFKRLCPGKSSFLYIHQNLQEKRIFCHFLPEHRQELQYSSNLFDILQLETLLLRYDALLLHASLIQVRGKAIAFTAPSGTGKSTQAALWAAHEGAEILNGDRAGIRSIQGTYHGFGLPYAGSSRVYLNRHAPLSAIVVLRQGPENQIRRLRPGEAFRHLYPELSFQRWDASITQEIMELLSALLQQIPVFLLVCRPDREAVEITKNAIEKDVNP